MTTVLSKHLANLKSRIDPFLKQALAKWKLLQPREQRLIAGLSGLLLLSILYIFASALIDYQIHLKKELAHLNSFKLYSQQAAGAYKRVDKIEANAFNSVNLEQIKGDVSQVLQVKDPDILIQDGQMTVNVPNAEFSQVMALIDQFRRSYAIFPSQVTVTRQSRTGFVSFNATFWIKQ